MAADRTTYRATAIRSGDWWAIDIADLEFGHTQAKRHEIEDMARDLIASLLDVEPDSFDLKIEVQG